MQTKWWLMAIFYHGNNQQNVGCDCPSAGGAILNGLDNIRQYLIATKESYNFG